MHCQLQTHVCRMETLPKCSGITECLSVVHHVQKNRTCRKPELGPVTEPVPVTDLSQLTSARSPFH
jgi:hypothetical protein